MFHEYVKIRLPFYSDLSVKLINILKDFYNGRIFFESNTGRYSQYIKRKHRANILDPYKDPVDNSLIIIKDNTSFYGKEKDINVEMIPCIFTGFFDEHNQIEIWNGPGHETFADLITSFLRFLGSTIGPRYKNNQIRFNYNFYDNDSNKHVTVDEAVNLISYQIMSEFLKGASTTCLIKKYGQEAVENLIGKTPSIEEENLISSMFKERNVKIKRKIKSCEDARFNYQKNNALSQEKLNNNVNLLKDKYRKKREEIQNLIKLNRKIAICE